MKNREIADMFEAIADMLELLGGNAFRVNSYRKASRVIGDLTDDVADLAEAGGLQKLPGIGASTAKKIVEYLETGTMERYEELAAEVPEGVIEMMHVPGVGPKTAGLVYKEAGIDSVTGLAEAIEAGQLTDLPGLGPKKLENILKGVAVYLAGQERVLLGRALPVAEEIAEAMRKVPGVGQVLPAGSLRRRRETVGDIDILVASTEGKAVVEAFVGLRQVRDVLAAGETKGSVRVEGGLQVDCRVVPPESFGAAAQYFTGSKAHNVRLREIAIGKKLKLNEYGVFSGDEPVAGETEEAVYAALGLPWVPPELREDRGEIEAAQAGELPDLVELDDVQGDLHLHSTWSDGGASIEQMAEACRALGYRYLCVTDHSQSLTIAGGLSPEQLARQREEIDELNRTLEGFRILSGCEVDILGDGSLDLPDDVLAGLDFVIASIHTGMTQSADRITRRIIAAMEHPHVHAIAHPTGRIIGQREPYAIDFEALVRAAADTGTALEINAYVERLDLNDVHARAARDAGVRLVIDTDAHAPDQLAMMRFGVATARRGWATRADVLNALPLKELLAVLKRKDA